MIESFYILAVTLCFCLDYPADRSGNFWQFSGALKAIRFDRFKFWKIEKERECRINLSDQPSRGAV
ncbi:hypothetical protein [Sphingopyxis sp.]|jgi:hypothetical protein|uniref:hypothetical protein n=1 Tax=Sphingopyxis sp. TaxID=1908224 RepID=UPI003F6F3E91